jgi:pilus assembly protein Flp/PilA
MKDKFLAFFREEEGLTTVEYAIGGALVSLFIVGAFRALGVRISAVINAITAAI